MIRPATSSDAARVFHLVCCAQGAQGPYGDFARAYQGHLDDDDDFCLVAEDDEGTVWGYIALRATDETDAHDPMAITNIVVASAQTGMRALFVARAYRLVHALRHYARSFTPKAECVPRLGVA